MVAAAMRPCHTGLHAGLHILQQAVQTWTHDNICAPLNCPQATQLEASRDRAVKEGQEAARRMQTENSRLEAGIERARTCAEEWAATAAEAQHAAQLAAAAAKKAKEEAEERVAAAQRAQREAEQQATATRQAQEDAERRAAAEKAAKDEATEKLATYRALLKQIK